MKPQGHTVLITGGATGIGLALAAQFLAAGNTVIICGRREAALAEAKARHPKLYTFVADVADAASREALATWVLATHPTLNVLINNAGIQRRIDLKAGESALVKQGGEIETNLSAVIYLTARLLPHILQQPSGAVVQVGSGLGIVPIAAMPIYCSTKAALHTYSRCLRYQLKATAVRVFELLPPVVDTELDQGARSARGEQNKGLSPARVAKDFWQAWLADRQLVPVGLVKLLLRMNRIAPEFIFGKLSGKVRL
jgi:uncharacterized oxidoreductase